MQRLTKQEINTLAASFYPAIRAYFESEKVMTEMFTNDMIEDIADSEMALQKRLDDLEAQKEKPEIDIMREELQQEVLTRDKIVFGLLNWGIGTYIKHIRRLSILCLV